MKARQIEFPLSVAVCAWCKPQERGATLGEISHGICLRHLRNLRLETQGHTLPPRRKRLHIPRAPDTLLPL
jgi:hypothetical protein